MIVGSVVNAVGWCWCDNGCDFFLCTFSFCGILSVTWPLALMELIFWYMISDMYISKVLWIVVPVTTPQSPALIWILNNTFLVVTENGNTMKGACKLRRLSMKCCLLFGLSIMCFSLSRCVLFVVIMRFMFFLGVTQLIRVVNDCLVLVRVTSFL